MNKKYLEKIDFKKQIARNKRNSVLFMILIFCLLGLVGWAIGKISGIGIFGSLLFFSLFSLIYIWISYYYSDKISLMAVRATKADPIKYKKLYSIVKNLCEESNLPMPKLYIMSSQSINAFASGRDHKHAVICVTEGALKKLNEEELKGVLAHELTHIKNYDIRFVSIVCVAVGLIEIISQLFLRSLWYGRREERNNFLIIIGIILAIFAPISAKLVQLAISRRREFMADAGSVEINHSPNGLIGALEKIKTDYPIKVSAAVAPMFFSDPLKKRIFAIFETHPPIDERIKFLKMMKK